MRLREYLTATPLQDRRRAVVKTLLYRTLMVLITVTVAFLVTQDLSQALSIGLVTNVIKTGTYYAYERSWDRVGWGVSTVE